MESKSESQIFSLGYRQWEKKLLGPVYRVFSIIFNEAKTALGSRMVKVLLAIRSIIMVVGIFKLITVGLFQITILVSFDTFLGMMSPTFLPFLADGSIFVKIFAATLGHQFGFFDVVLVGWVGSTMISNDREYNSITLYLARPIRKLEYVIGKYGAVMLYALSFTWLPSTFYFFSLEAIMQRTFEQLISDVFSLYFPLLLAGFINSFFLTTLVLALSSITKRAQYVGILTAAINPLSLLLSQITRNSLSFDFWYLFSFPIVLKSIQLWLMGVPPSHYYESGGLLPNINIAICFIYIGLLTAGFLYLLSRSVKKLELSE